MDRSPTSTRSERSLQGHEIPSRSNKSTKNVSSLRSSSVASSAETLVELPFITPSCSLVLQLTRVRHVQHALIASKLATCQIKTFQQAVDAYAATNGNTILNKAQFIQLVRSVPDLQTDETFKPMEETLARLFRSFHATNRTNLYQLLSGCLVLLPGDVKRKIEIAIEFSLCSCGVDRSAPLTLSIVQTAMGCLLLALSAIFDVLTAKKNDSLETIASMLITCVEETITRMLAANALSKDDPVSLEEHLWPSIEANTRDSNTLAWFELLDSTQWPRSKEMAVLSVQGSYLKRNVDDLDENNVLQEDVEGTKLSFRFSSVDGGVLTIGEQQALALYDLLLESHFTRASPQAMYDTFVQHTSDGLLEEETFLEALEELLSMTDTRHLMENNVFLEKMLDLFRSFLSEKSSTVDAYEIAAGLSLLTWGSKSDKLASAFHFFDVESKGSLNRQQLWRFLRSVLITLLHVSPPLGALLEQRHGSWAALVDLGEEEIVDAIMEECFVNGDSDDEEEVEDDDGTEKDGKDCMNEIVQASSDMRLELVSFEDFGRWYNGGGYKEMSWLELLDLRKWVFVSASFDLEGLDTRSVDPMVASHNYYSANNIQVDIDASDPPDGVPGIKKPYFTFADVIDEVDDEDEAVPMQINRSSGSLESSSTAVQSNNSSSPATLPAICLKNEIVLEFDLPFDTSDEAMTELLITTLSFDNGDLIQYFELQRVTKLNYVQLHRVYDVFEPYMDNLMNSCIEKSTFDRCVGTLLPLNVAPSVAAAFHTNSNARMLAPQSMKQEKDSKMVADTLSRLFFAFNRGGTGKIDSIEFVSAFIMFCAGSKSEKLAFAYRLFDADDDGCLTRREMWKFLRSFLTMLLALGNGSELSAKAIANVADTTAIEIADCIFKDTDKTFSTRESFTTHEERNPRHSLDASIQHESTSTTSTVRHHSNARYEHRGSLPGNEKLHLFGAASHAAGAGAGSAFIRGGVVSFEEFAVWYSQQGYAIIAWIELLDTKKWPEVPHSVSDAILRYISRQQHALENAIQAGNDDIGSGSSNDTVSSNESNNRLDTSEERNCSDSDLTVLDTTAFRAIDRLAVESDMDAVSGISNLITSLPTSAAGVKDLSSVALQFKLTSYDNTFLRIRLKDVAIVYTISERMNLSRLTSGELVHLLKKKAHHRSLTKPGFLRAMRDLVPRDELSSEDQEFLSFHLLQIFTLFESESILPSNESHHEEHGNGGSMNTISVETAQLAAALCVFCGTTKSAKLGVLFKLFASHGDGHVTRRRLFELFKSILVVLFAFSSLNATTSQSNDPGSVQSWSTNSIAERAAGAVISKLFCEATCKRPDAISLAEFAAWYAAGGYMDCPWLELLDLSKWPAKEAFEASKREKPLIYAFDAVEEGNILHFTESDISTYLFMLRSTKFGDLSVSKVYDALLAYATPSAEDALKMSKTVETQNRTGQMYSYAAVEEDEGAYLVLTRTNFYECVRSLVTKHGMSEKAQQTSSKLLSRLFNVFDRKRCGRVNALELACGLSILGRGSKSQKLSLAFDFITKMRQQRHKTLASYVVPPPSTRLHGFGAQGTSGFGLGFGGALSNQVFMPGTNGARFPSTRGFGSIAQGMRSTKNRSVPSVSTTELNALPHSVLFIYLRSFLLALMALSDGTYRLGLEKIYAEADDFIEEAMGDLMTDVVANGSAVVASTNGLSGYGSTHSRTCVTFEQFGEWYNTGGYQLISWVELLDVTKWQQQQDFQDQTIAMTTTDLTSTSQRTRTASVMKSQNRGPLSTPAPMPVEPMQPIQQPTKPVTRRRQVRQSDIVSTSFVRGPFNPGFDDSKQRHGCESMNGRSVLSSDGPVMVFAVAKDAAELQFFHEDIVALKTFLRQTQLHSVTSWELQGAILEALDLPRRTSSKILLTQRSTFLRAVQKMCVTLPLMAPRSGSNGLLGFCNDEDTELLHRLLGVFSHECHENDERVVSDEDTDENDLIDVDAAICGLLVVCEGSMLEKLQCCAALLSDDESTFNGEGEGKEEFDEVMVQVETIRSSLMCFLMAFYAISSSLSAEVARDSAERGAVAVLESFLEVVSEKSSAGFKISARKEKVEEKVSLRVFTDWFSNVGYPTHSWLELVVLHHWPAAMNVCGSNGLPDAL
ncbi:hypothetical protein CCR75_007448 [Bremia lactucae]|uniref:EF-hand domain-containing protein n=1 Tax=Bremia lactucae TaxID=4779 RepID=A0A976NYX5_BRELC|nr:hypothetical protein CCR75_007448 [Bremia lactucae]